MTRAEYIMDLTSSKGKKLSWEPVSLFSRISVLYHGSTPLCQVWESFDHYKKLTESAGFPDLIESMKPAMAGPLQTLHAEVKTDPTTALEAPVTEVTIVSIKEGKTFEDVRPLGEALDASCHLLKGNHVPSSWGPVVQDVQKIGVAVGWDSVEVSSIYSLASWQSIMNHLAIYRHMKRCLGFHPSARFSAI